MHIRIFSKAEMDEGSVMGMLKRRFDYGCVMEMIDGEIYELFYSFRTEFDEMPSLNRKSFKPPNLWNKF